MSDNRRSKSLLRKSATLFLAAAVLMVFAPGCNVVKSIQTELFDTMNFEDDSEYTAVEEVSSVECAYYSAVSVTYGYDSLSSDTQRECYSSIVEQSYRISEDTSDNGLYAVGKVVVEDDFSEADMRVCILAVTMDHPEIFWISNQFSYGAMNGTTTLQMYSYVSGTQCAELVEEMDSALDEIMLGVPDGLNEYHLEKYIHDTLLDICGYADGVSTTSDGWTNFSAYGAIVQGSAVCEGYSYAFSLLLSKVGIYSYCVNGSGNDDLHMWNSVNIDGNWYHTDATWDDTDGAYHSYFNLSREQIETDHVIASLYTDMTDEQIAGSEGETFNLFVPECTAESANFYVVESTYIYDFDECSDIMVYDLVAAAQNGDTEFYIRLDSSLDFQSSLDSMFYSEPYYLFGYISQANKQLTDDYGGSYQINSENASIVILEKFNSIILKLEYV